MLHSETSPFQAGPPEGGGLANHRGIIRPVPAVLDVVAVISNPVRYRSRYDLYRAFERHVIASGARLTTVELAYGDRPFEVTTAGNPRHVQFRSRHELWHKENLVNLGVQRLPSDWQHVAWVDADVSFARPDWVQETLQQLQHHPIVQMFSRTLDLGPGSEILPHYFNPGLKPASWAYCHVNGIPQANTDLAKSLATGKMDVAEGPYGAESTEFYWHPGFAWAARREAWDQLGGLIDHSILGAGDYLMASALTGHLSLSGWLPESYTRPILEWKARADRHIRGDLGYVEGLLLHHFHGAKRKRGYKDRWRIFLDSAFDPSLDLKRDWQGVLQLTERNPVLRDLIRAYFRSRDEDGTEI